MIDYGDFKDLLRRIAFDKYYKIKDLILQKIQIMMDTKNVLLQWFTIFLIKNHWQIDFATAGDAIKSKIMSNQQQKNCTSQFLENKKRKVYSSFKDIIWGADLADMWFISKYNKGIRYLSCVLCDIYSKYALVVL